MKSIKPFPPVTNTSAEAQHGSSEAFKPRTAPSRQIEVVLDGLGSFRPVLLQNDESGFKWAGGNLWIGFRGEHAFRWESATKEGVQGTRLVHEEVFTGYLSSLLMGEDNWLANLIGLRKQSEENFWKWTEEFKERCEEGGARM